MVRNAASRAMSVRECTPSFFRMWETWVATVRLDSNSLAAISGLDIPPSTSAAILDSAGVRLSQPLVGISNDRDLSNGRMLIEQ